VVTDTNYKYLTVGGVEGAQQCVINKKCVKKPSWIISIGPNARSTVVIDAKIKSKWVNAVDNKGRDEFTFEESSGGSSTSTTTTTTTTTVTTGSKEYEG